MYKCGKCGKRLEMKKEDPIRCPYCGGKLLLKERANVIKRVEAR